MRIEKKEAKSILKLSLSINGTPVNGISNIFHENLLQRDCGIQTNGSQS